MSECQSCNCLFGIRYDLYVGNLDQIYANFTCGEWYAKLPICNAELRIQSHNAAPYMYTLPNGDVDGIIPGRLPLLVTFLIWFIWLRNSFATVNHSKLWSDLFNSLPYHVQSEVGLG